ncbi:MAG: efflux transporter outer membrane subunit [Pseudomonadota bacterium]
MNRIDRIAFLPLLLILLLPACAAMGPNFAPPEVDAPEQYRREISPEAHANRNWWDLFNDPALAALVTQALENNRDVKVAVARLEEARAYLGTTRADQYPLINIEAGASSGTFSGRSRSLETTSNVYLAPALSWEIDFWGRYRRSTESAQAALVSSQFGVRTVQLGLIADVVGTYYQLLDYYQRLEISQRTLTSRQGSLDIIQQRFDKGIIPEIDLNQAQIQLEIAAAAIPLYDRQIAITENALSILVGRLPYSVETGAPLRLQQFPPGIPLGIPADILTRRPDIAAAMADLHAQTAKIGVAVALRLPAVSLTGLLGVASTDLGSVTSSGGAWYVGGTLLGPIVDFGKGKQQVVIEEAKTRQSLFTYEQTVLNAFREVEDALVEVQTLRVQIAAVERKLAAAKNAGTLSAERYDKGVTSYLEVQDADRTLFSVELELSELRQQYFTGYVKLYKALGGGWLTRQEMTAAGEGS